MHAPYINESHLPEKKAKTRSTMYHHMGASLYFFMAYIEQKHERTGSRLKASYAYLIMRVWLCSVDRKFERISGMSTPEENDVHHKSTNLGSVNKDRKSCIFSEAN